MHDITSRYAFSKAPIYLLGFVCLTLPLLYWPPLFDASSLPREMIIAVCAGIGLILFCLDSIYKLSTITWNPVHLLIIGLGIWAVLSFFWSVDKGSSLLGITQFLSLLTFALLASRLSTQHIFEYILPLTLISASIAGLIGILQHFGVNPLLLRQQPPPASTFVNINYAANYFDLITPVALATLLLQPRTNKPQAILATIAFTLSLGFIVISRSRGSLLGLLVAVIAFYVVIRGIPDLKIQLKRAARIHFWSLILSLSIVIALAFTKTHIGPSAEKFNALLTLSPDTSIHLRLLFYQNALAGFRDRLWTGVGYGAFIMGFAPYIDAVHPITIVNQNNIIQYLHSDPLQMFFELGIPGGLVSIIIYLFIVTMSYKIIKSSSKTSHRFLGLGLMLALLASGAHAWVDFPLRLPTSAFFFWLWSGIVMGVYLKIFPAGEFKLIKSASLAIGLFGVAFTIYSSRLYIHYLEANRDVRTAMYHALRHDCPSVFRLSDKAMDNFGLDHLTRFWYAKVYTYCDAPNDQRLQAMNRILYLDPNMPLPYLTRAKIELSNHEFVAAANDFNIFRKFLPHLPDGYLGLAQVADKLGDQKQAEFWIKQAYEHSRDKMYGKK